jgi:hypothetical protein
MDDFLNSLIQYFEENPTLGKWLVCHPAMTHRLSSFDQPHCIILVSARLWVSAKCPLEQCYICDDEQMDALMKNDPEWIEYKARLKGGADESQI